MPYFRKCRTVAQMMSQPQIYVDLGSFNFGEGPGFCGNEPRHSSKEAPENGFFGVIPVLIPCLLEPKRRALADPNSQAVDGRSPLHRAAVHGWLPIARLLVEHGGDPELADDDGRTPTQLAAKDAPPQATLVPRSSGDQSC